MSESSARSASPRAAYHLRRVARLTLHLRRAEDEAEQARLRAAITHHKAKAASFSPTRKEPVS